VFKRRRPKSYFRIVGEAFWPRGGWRRASIYVVHRLRRLPDPAHRISRGIFAGVFVSFTPFYGLHFLAAALVAWVMRGNILAALLATFFGNPITFPIIAAVSVEFGAWMLGLPPVPLPKVVSAFSLASVELWENLKAIVTPATAEWSHLGDFFRYVFLPYLVGGILPGIAAGLVAYYASYPLILSYQRGRIHRLKERFEKRRRAIEAARAERAAHEPQGEGADAAGKGAKVAPSGTRPREAG
jgi:uncharacterized protein (DUF2062 family)